MGDISFRVLDMASWPAPTLAVGASQACGTSMPAALRRRVTAIGRAALETAWAILPADHQIRMVLASRYGEYRRTFDLFSELIEEGTVSPADFSMSVHHALIGLLSIVRGNRAGHTAIAAGPDSFGYGLLDAVACLAEDAAPVMMVYFDEPLPAIYAPTLSDDIAAPFVLAMVIAAPSGNDNDCLVLSMTGKAGNEPATPAQAQEFRDFLASSRTELRLSGERHDWWWHRAA
jgi:hypothetical protein